MPRYGLVAIVKDEEDVIDDFLIAAKQYAEVATIFDTGSTDATPAKIEAVFPGALHHSTWVNFGHNRSEAFMAARGTADWLLALDADMRVSIDDDFEPDPAISAYLIEMGNGGDFRWRLPLLLRGDLPWISVGAVHEYTCLEDGADWAAIPTDKVRIWYPERPSPGKSRWHADMLEDALAQDPNNSRNVFYLAQSYRDLGDYSRAKQLYQKRAQMGGWDQEAWYASYMAATLEETWGKRATELLECWESRPWRLEPLATLCRELNSRNFHHTAYALTGGPFPANNDLLFVHYNVYEWGIIFERSIAAWWVGNKEECRRLCDLLLTNERLPGNIRTQVITNREFCNV